MIIVSFLNNNGVFFKRFEDVHNFSLEFFFSIIYNKYIFKSNIANFRGISRYKNQLNAVIVLFIIQKKEIKHGKRK